jgi:60 kDa SS-A/Ro ribonucleoprotein
MRTNVAMRVAGVQTHELGTAQRVSPLLELRRSVLTCLLYENTFYEKGSDIATRIADLVTRVKPEEVAALAVEARTRMYLRHVPLHLTRELARQKGNGRLVEQTLYQIIQRPDELSEFVAMFLKDGKRTLTAGIKRGLAASFTKFNEYQLSKWNRDNEIKLRDVLFLVHANPKDEQQAELWKKLINKTLEPADTWETELSAGKRKKETFERLLREGKLGGMACLMNLRNCLQSGVDENLIRERLAKGCEKALPFRFVTAARYAPSLEDAIETAMLKAIEELEPLSGRTGLLIDVSGSMEAKLIEKGETTRIDAAAGLAILLREKAESVRVATFSTTTVEVPPRRGFALRDAINTSQPHGGTYLAGAISTLSKHWRDLDRLIVVTDEQSADGNQAGFAPRNYLINVAPYQYGVSYGNGYTRLDGWSDQCVAFIIEHERLEA